MAFLEAKGVSKSYGSGGSRTQVLGHTDIAIEKGEFVAILGYSGTGKTTLLSILAGLLTPDTGQVLLDGKVVTEPGPERGVVFQSYSLLPWQTAYENVYLAVDQVHGGKSPEEKRKHTEEFLALVNLSPARNKKPAQLSGGMRQRVALARALAMQPAVLLMDEPLGALDALTRASLQSEIESIWRNHRTTVVMITNDVDEAILLSDRIIPLGVGPAATLGPSFMVDIERPRDRKALNHDQRFKRLRSEVTQYLLAAAARARPAAALKRESVRESELAKVEVAKVEVAT